MLDIKLNEEQISKIKIISKEYSELRKRLNELSSIGYLTYAPELKYCTDNASMVASSAYFFNNTFDNIDVEVFSRA